METKPTINTRRIIQHIKKLLKNRAVVEHIEASDGVLNGAVCKQLERVIQQDGSYTKVNYAQLIPSGNRLVLSMMVDGRQVPEFAIYS